MTTNSVVRTLVFVGVLIAVPKIAEGIVDVGECTVKGIKRGIKDIKFHHEMKKGMKEGRILKMHGEYFVIIEDGTLAN